LPGLEIYGTIFHLDQYIIPKSPVKRLEFIIGLFCTIFGFLIAIYKGAPHHDTSIFRYRIGKHIGTICMRSAIVLWTRLAFGIGFYQKASKVRNETVDFIGLVFPPGFYLWV